MDVKTEYGISVILPIYNGFPLLKESVESVLDQEGVDFQLLIGDDLSSDGSLQYVNSIQDTKVRVIENSKNLGLFGNLNNLIKSAKYELIHLWSQDDIMLPGCLEETINFHSRYPTVGYVFSKYITINDKGHSLLEQSIQQYELVSEQDHAKISLVAGSFPGNIANVSLKKQDIADVGFFNRKMKYSGDLHMWCMLSKNKQVGIIQKHLIKLRSHEGQLSRSPKMWIYRLKENKVIQKEFLKRIDPVKLKYVNTGLNWRIYTQYFGLLIRLIRLKQFGLAKEYFTELSRQRNILLVMIRYIVFLVFRLFQKEQWLIKRLYYKKLLD